MMEFYSEAGFGVLTAMIAAAALTHGAAGVGFPLVATPLLSMIMDVRQAVMILVIPTIVINVSNILHGGGWRRSVYQYWPLALWGIIGSFTGTHLLLYFPDAVFRPLLSFLLICYLFADRAGFRFSRTNDHSRGAMALFGFAAGLCGGMVNVMLPPLVIFALETNMPKERMIQVFNLCFLTGKLTQGGVLFSADRITAPILKTSLLLAGIGLLVMLSGLVIRRHIETRTYRKGLKVFLGLMAVLLLIKSALPFFRY